MDSPQLLCKVVLIGDSGVGKTSILNKRIYEKFSFHTTHTELGQMNTLKLKINDKEITLKLWDTAGQEKYRTITIQFYRETKGAFLVFDMTEHQSFDNIKFWAKQLRNHGGDDVKKVILANKCDLTDKLVVTEEEIKELAKQINANYFIVSAYTSENIIECFDFMALELMKNCYNQQENKGLQSKQLSANTESVLDQKQKNKQSSGCC
ncbi:unnamed protein product [Paramecium pentaurelia]|uniref:Uncharacterized protein n=1 Tax=Paramecium pentaurelia TaxID=43138 RepID=A0A8S1UYB8_9CILI|nr:unnamed protein product [Paramecium pentaurelia]